MRYIVLALLFVTVITAASYLGLTQKREPQETTPSPTSSSNTVSAKKTATLSIIPPQNITDEANLFTITLPGDWEVLKEGAQGIRVSGINAESPDFEIRSDTDAEGPFTPMYYESGATLQVSVQNDTSATTQKPAGVISKETPYTISGIEGTYYTFKEPSTAKGQLHALQFVRNGNSYYFRFGYNPETYTEGETVFLSVLESLTFNEE